tara:strand:- start:7312 stop:14292 length:6981 start_codon:yes stop_codon:yes gene_type:complete
MPESLDDIKRRVQQKLIIPNYSKAIVLNPDEVSQYDDNFIIPLESDWRSARQEEMAQTQPGIDQLANGVVKGAGLAVTTFADTFGGTVFGIGNMIAKGAAGDIESGGDLLNAFVNNPFSNAMQDINEGMESTFANYRSKAEQDAGLLDQMFDADKAANFWGDMFIKNLGFAGGAMAAGMVSGNLFSNLGKAFTQKKEVELFNKMTKSIATGEAKNIDEAIALLQKAPELTNTAAAEIKGMLESGAKTYRNWNRANQITSSAIAATGEARIEALGNGRQFYESNKNTLDQEYIDPTTGQVKLGREQEYETKLKSLDENVKGFQNAEFLWNSVLLTASNFAGYRDMFAKSYALNAKRFEGSIKMAALNELKAGENVATAIKPKWYNTLGKAAISSNREGMEEFFQGVVQKSAEDYYSGKFTGAKEGGITDIISSVGQGLSNSTNQEGLTNYFLGAFTGLIMPGAGLYQSFKDANAENVEAQERAGNINKAFNEYSAELKQDPTRTIINFQEMLNRSANLDKAQQQALLNSDKYNYESLKHEKFYNLANAYIKAGKYEELSDMLKDETKLSADDIRNKYTIPVDPKDETKGKKSFFDAKWSDDDVMTYIRKQSSTNLKAVEDLKNVTEDLEAMFGEQIALVSDGDKTKQVAIKDILNRSLYLGETHDKRIVDVYNEVTAAIMKVTNNAYVLADFSQLNPTTIKNLTTEDLDKLDKAIDSISKLNISKIEQLDLIEKLNDLTQLVGERKAMNSAWIRLTNNNFTQTLNIIAKADKEAVETKAAEEAKQLSNDEKINIVRENSKRAGWVDKGGNGIIGNQFVMKVAGKNTAFELVPINITELRKEFEDEKNKALEGLDPITDKEKIADIIQKYNDKLQTIIEDRKTKGLLLKNIKTGEYVKNKKGVLQLFNEEFIVKYFDKINFVNKQQTLINKVKSTAIKTNAAKIKALEAVANTLNKEIITTIEEAKKVVLEQDALKEELAEQQKLYKETGNIKSKGAINKNIKALNERIQELEKVKEDISKVFNQLTSQKNDLLLVVEEMKDSFKKGLDFSLNEFLERLDQMNLESIDKIWAKKLSKDLEELANTDDIDYALSQLNTLKNNVTEQIRLLRKQSDLLQAFIDESNDFKNWVFATKIDDLPQWFKAKWKVSDKDKLAIAELLKNPKTKSKVDYIFKKFANTYNLTIQETREEFRNDLKEINLQLSYTDRQSLENEAVVTKQQLAELEQNLIDINNLIRFNDNRKLFENLNNALQSIKIEYSTILNRDRKDEISNLPDSQKAGDEEFNPKPIHTNIAGRTLNSNALSDHLFYTTNMTVEYITNAEGKLETVYDADGYPVVNTNEDSIRWNNFLEQNTPDITNSKYVLRTYLLSGAKIPADLKEAALKRISDGGGTHNPANDIVTVLVNTANGEFVKSDDQGKVSKTGNYVYTFLPLADRLIENKGKSKVNLNALVNFFMRNSSMEVKDHTNIHLTDPTKYITVGNKQLTPSQFKDLVTDFAKANYNEFIAELKANMEANETTYLKAPGVTNGILLTRKSDKDVAKSPMSSVAEVLKNKRGLDSQNPEGLENIGVYVIDDIKVWEIPGSGIKIKNGKKGAVIVYNKETKEYFYANQRKLSTEDKKLIIYYLQQSRVQTESSLSEKKLNVGNDGKSYYMDENEGNNVKLTDIRIFGKPGTLSLMNNIIFWGGSKNPGSKNTIYLKSNKVYFSNPNQGWAITAIDLANLDNPKYNLDFMAFLDTKRHNISKNMFATNKFYKHPYINGKGELAWKTYQGGYKDFLLNSKDPILITNAVNSNSKYNGNKMLFASKNVILDSSNNGKPKILNKLQAEPVQTPKEAPKPAAAPSAKPSSGPAAGKDAPTEAEFDENKIVFGGNLPAGLRGASAAGSQPTATVTTAKNLFNEVVEAHYGSFIYQSSKFLEQVGLTSPEVYGNNFEKVFKSIIKDKGLNTIISGALFSRIQFIFENRLTNKTTGVQELIEYINKNFNLNIKLESKTYEELSKELDKLEFELMINVMGNNSLSADQKLQKSKELTLTRNNWYQETSAILNSILSKIDSTIPKLEPRKATKENTASISNYSRKETLDNLVANLKVKNKDSHQRVMSILNNYSISFDDFIKNIEDYYKSSVSTPAATTPSNTMNGESLFPTTPETVEVPSKRAEAEKKALQILNMFATPGNKEVEYQGDEGMPRTLEDEGITNQNNSTLGKIIATIKKLPPIPYNITSSSVEEFKDKLTDELVDAGLLNDIVDVTSNIDKLVNEQLAALGGEEAVKDVSVTNKVVETEKTVEQTKQEIKDCNTGVNSKADDSTGGTETGDLNMFNGQNRNKKK